MMRVQCPGCKQALQVPPQSAGQMVRCPFCKQAMKVPPAAAPVAPRPPVTAPPPAAVRPEPPKPTAAPVAPPPPPPPPPKVRPEPPAAPVPVVAGEEMLMADEVLEEAAEEVVEEAPARASAQAPADFPDLGAVVREYVPRRWWIGLVVSLGLAAVGVPLVVVAETMRVKWLLLPSILTAVTAVLGVFICGLLGAVAFRQRVVLRENGFVYYTPFGTTACPWADVRGMYVVIHSMPTSTELRFDLRDDKKVWLSWMIRQQEDLAVHAARATTPLIRARVDRLLDRGEEAAFGPFVRVSRRDLRYWPNGPDKEELRIAWKEITDVIMGRFLTSPGAPGLAGAAIETQIRFMSDDVLVCVIASGNVANFPVFLDVIEKRFGLVPRML